MESGGQLSVSNLSGVIVGGYHLLERIGEGAIGSVYHAYHQGTRRHAAVKILPLENGSQKGDEQRRFLREAQTIASLNHPHIVSIYDYGTETTFNYLAMQLLSGGTVQERLAAFMAQSKLPSLADVSLLLDQIGSALRFAHQHNVLHRDVKPRNIMFDEFGTAYLVDFGVVKLLDETTSYTVQGTLIGTPPYMAPEQWTGAELTPAIDQYALGVLVFLLVTGRVPFEADTTHAMMYKHLSEPPPLAHEMVEGIPVAVSEAINRALAKQPENRFPTTSDFANAFAEAIERVEREATDFFTFPVRTALSANPETVPIIPPADVTPENLTLLHPVNAAPVVMPSNPLPPDPAPAVVPPMKTPASGEGSALKRLALGVGLGVVGLVACLIISVILILRSVNPQFPPNDFETEIAQSTFVVTDMPPTSITTIPTLQALPTVTPLPLPGSATQPVPGIDMGGGFPTTADSVITAADTSVRAVAFDPSGARLAFGGNSNVVQIWDSGGSSLIAELRGHTGIIYTIDYSADGSRIASAGENSLIRIWDANSGAELQTLSGHTGEIRKVVFSPDGTRLASVGQDGTVRIWDLATGSILHAITARNARILSAVFTPDSTMLITGWDDSIIVGWDVATGSQRVTFTGHSGEIRALDVRAQGDLLASSADDNTIRLWNISTGTLVATLAGHSRTIYDLTFSPDGTLLASGSADQSIALWDVAAQARVATLNGHQGWVFDVDFAGSTSRIASAGGDGTVRLWSIPTMG